MEVIQFFLSGIVFMAEFRVNGRVDNGVVMEQAGQYYVNTGHCFYHNRERHDFSDEQATEFKQFVATH